MNDTYLVNGKEYKLSPLKGKKARRMVPRLIETGAAVLTLAASNGVDLVALFDSEKDLPPATSLMTGALAVATYFKDEYATIEEEMFPVILCAEPKQWTEIDENATPVELYRALWTAIQYHLVTSFGLDVQEALKNLPEAPQEEAAELELEKKSS